MWGAVREGKVERIVESKYLKTSWNGYWKAIFLSSSDLRKELSETRINSNVIYLFCHPNASVCVWVNLLNCIIFEIKYANFQIENEWLSHFL